MDIYGIGRYNGCVFYEAEETTGDLHNSNFTKQIQKIVHFTPYEISVGNMISHTFEKIQ